MVGVGICLLCRMRHTVSRTVSARQQAIPIAHFLPVNKTSYVGHSGMFL